MWDGITREHDISRSYWLLQKEYSFMHRIDRTLLNPNTTTTATHSPQRKASFSRLKLRKLLNQTGPFRQGIVESILVAVSLRDLRAMPLLTVLQLWGDEAATPCSKPRCVASGPFRGKKLGNFQQNLKNLATWSSLTRSSATSTGGLTIFKYESGKFSYGRSQPANHPSLIMQSATCVGSIFRGMVEIPLLLYLGDMTRDRPCNNCCTWICDASMIGGSLPDNSDWHFGFNLLCLKSTGTTTPDNLFCPRVSKKSHLSLIFIIAK